MLTSYRQSGAALLALLATLMLLVGSLSVAAMHLLFNGRQLAAQQLDREIAFRSAEAALLDAEADLLAAITSDGDRLAHWPAPGTCASGAQSGLCRADGDRSAWLAWIDGDVTNSVGVALGTFTGASLPTLPDDVIGATALSRYVIEILDDRSEQGAEQVAGMWPRFRITALGMGRDTGIRVALQSEFQP